MMHTKIGTNVVATVFVVVVGLCVGVGMMGICDGDMWGFLQA